MAPPRNGTGNLAFDREDSSGASAPLEFTGERIIPGAVSDGLWLEHSSRYHFVATFAARRRVIDLGTGAGYGAEILRQGGASAVVGIDLAEDAVRYADDHYQSDAVQFLVADACETPFPPKSFDVVTCFELIEHLTEWSALLAEAARLLRDDGLLVISTPNRRTYTEESPNPPNPFHVHEFDLREFRDALGAHFPSVRFYSQARTEGVLFRGSSRNGTPPALHATYGTDWDLEGTDFFCAVAAKGDLGPDLADHFHAGSDHELADRTRHVLALQAEVESGGSAGQREAQRLTREIEALRDRVIEEGEVLRLRSSRRDRDFVALSANCKSLLEAIRALQSHSALTESHLDQQRREIELLTTRNERLESMVEMLTRSKPWRLYDSLGQWARRPWARDSMPPILASAFVDTATELRLSESTSVPSELRRRADQIVFEQPEHPETSIIIPVHGQPELVIECLESITLHRPPGPIEVIVVDDGSPGEVTDLLRRVRGLRLVSQSPARGFVDAVNEGARRARGDYVLLLNSDAQLTSGAVLALRSTFEDFPQAGLVGAKLVYPDGRLQEVGVTVWRDGTGHQIGHGQDSDFPDFGHAREVDYCSGACLMMPRALFESLQGLDEEFRPGFYEDVDLAFRVRAAGRSVVCQPAARVVHVGGASAGNDPQVGMRAFQEPNRHRFVERWKSTLERHDPPNDRDPARSRSSRGRILVIDHYVPRRNEDAGSLRMFHLLRLLRQEGWHVTLLPDNLQPGDPHRAELEASGIRVICAPHCMSPLTHLEEEGRDYDAVLLSRVTVAAAWIDPVREVCPRARVIFDTVDLHHVREARGAEMSGDEALRRASDLTRRREAAVTARADVTIAVSAEEARCLEDLVPGARTAVLPTIHEVVPGRTPFRERRGALFVGGFRHPPNADAIGWFLDEVWPLVLERLPDAELFVVGSHMPADLSSRQAPGLNLLGWVPDLEPLYERVRLTIAPLRYGAGVKGKICESLARGVPSIATPLATEGLHAREGTGIRIADDPIAFSEAFTEVHSSARVWNELSSGGVEHAKRYFSVEAASVTVRDLLRSLRDE